MAERTDVSSDAPEKKFKNSSEIIESRRNFTRNQNKDQEESCGTTNTRKNMNNNDLTANHLSRKTEEQQTQDDNEQRINKRTKWTLEMNIDVVRCYYEALKDPEATT